MSHSPLFKILKDSYSNPSDEEFQNSPDDRYLWQVIVNGNQVSYQGKRRLQDSEIQQMTEVFFSSKDCLVVRENRKMYLRGDNLVYAPPENEYLKSIGLIFWLPLFTLVKKIAIPIFFYYPLKALSTYCNLFTDRVKSLEDDHYMQNRRPLRALIGVVIHPIISALGLIPFSSNYFNKYNGDLERWVNGHTDKDLETKSIARRCREAPYAAACQQPSFKFSLNDFSLDIDEIQTEKTKDLAFLALIGRPFGSRSVEVHRISKTFGGETPKVSMRHV